MERRDFFAKAALSTLATWVTPSDNLFGRILQDDNKPFFKISLNQWSLFGSFIGEMEGGWSWAKFMQYLETDPNQILQGVNPMDFPKITREEYGIDAIEIEASLYYAHVTDYDYFKDFKLRCDDYGVKCWLLQNVWAGNLASINGKPPKENCPKLF